MGLVAFSPIDALFTPPGEGAGKHGGSPGLPDTFTDLLAALLGAAAGESAEVAADQATSKESAASLLALLAAAPGKVADDSKGMPAMAALLASLLHPAATPADPVSAEKDADQSTAPAAAATATTTAPSDIAAATAADAALAAGDAPATPAVGAQPASETATTPATGDATGTEELAAVTPSVRPTAPATGQDATTVSTATTVVEAASATPTQTAGETPAAASTGQVDGPHHHDGPRNVKADDGPDPAGPPVTQTIQEGVVRFVGNAQKDRHETGHDGPDLSDHNPGVPHASAQGIAHASDNSAVAQLRTPAPDTPPVDQVAAPPPPAAQPPPVEQVAHAIIGKVQDGGGEAHIRLDPPDLGEVTIHVRISGDHVRVDVHAERTETMQMLRDQSLDLTNLLSGRGLDLTDVYVGLGGRQAPDTRDNEGANGRSRQGQGDEFANLLGIDAEPPATDWFNRLRSAYNPDGTHVYRI